MEAADHEAEAEAARKMAELVERVRSQSGRANMSTGEVIAFLVERGDLEGTALLAVLNDPFQQP